MASVSVHASALNIVFSVQKSSKQISPHHFQTLSSSSCLFPCPSMVKLGCCKDRSETPILWNSGQTLVPSSLYYPDLKHSMIYLIWARIIIKPKISPVICFEEMLQILLSHFKEKTDLWAERMSWDCNNNISKGSKVFVRNLVILIHLPYTDCLIRYFDNPFKRLQSTIKVQIHTEQIAYSCL